MYKLAVFDLDGTLVDSLWDIANACNYTLRTLGYPERTTEEIQSYLGDGAHKLVERFLPAEVLHNTEVFNKAFNIYREYYSTHSQIETKPYPGIISMLGELRLYDVKTGVLSNKPHDDTVHIVQSTFGALFEVVYGQRSNVSRKPSPAALLEIMEQLSITADEVIYIGDTSVDIQTGKSAGVTTVGVGWGFRPVVELRDAGADYIVDNAKQLEQLILRKELPNEEK